MKRSWFAFAALGAMAVLMLAVLTSAPAQQKSTLQIQGQILRTSPEQFVIQTPERKEITIYTTPQTRYLLDGRTVPYSELRVGSNITTIYSVQGDRWMANTVTVVPAQPAPQPQPQQPPPQREQPPQPLQQPQGTLIEGEIVRMVGQDQFMLRTADNKEMAMHVNAQTTYLVNNQAAQFKDLRAGMNIAVYFDVKGQQNMARQIVALTLLQGEVVRTVERDQVILRTPEQKEVIVYVTPQTRYLLSPQGGQFTDLRPGANIGVWYNVHNQRHTAFRIFPHRR